jgi:cell division septation protein DedD
VDPYLDYPAVTRTWNAGQQDAAVDAVFEAFREYMDAMQPQNDQWAAIASREGMRLLAYECGQGWQLVGNNNAPPLTDLYSKVQRDPRMKDFLLDYFAWLSPYEFGNYYSHTFPDNAGVSWGYNSHELEPSPKVDACEMWRDGKIPPPKPPAPTFIADGSFEQVQVGTGKFQYTPNGSPWTFTAGAGIAANASGFTGGNPAAPSGTQVAFLQGTGSFSQTIASLPAGSYLLSFYAAQRGGNNQAAKQDFGVFVDGISLGTFTPSGSSYAPYKTAPFTVSAGSHTIAFRGLNTAGGDNTAFIDRVAVSTSPSQVSPTPTPTPVTPTPTPVTPTPTPVTPTPTPVTPTPTPVTPTPTPTPDPELIELQSRISGSADLIRALIPSLNTQGNPASLRRQIQSIGAHLQAILDSLDAPYA